MSVQSMAIAVLLVSFLVMILLRFPIAYAVALSSLLCLLSQGLPLTTICQQMVKGISSFSLMAVPFFITPKTGGKGRPSKLPSPGTGSTPKIWTALSRWMMKSLLWPSLIW